MARVMARGLGSGGLPWRETMPDTEGSVETTTPMAYSTTMRFVETPVFTRALKRLLHDEPYRRLQIALMLRPGQGALIRGSGGLRKLRWAAPDTGKRGGLRVIYYWSPTELAFYMLYVYTKAEQGDLTPAQVKILGCLVREEFK